jgi:NTE family protein
MTEGTSRPGDAEPDTQPAGGAGQAVKSINLALQGGGAHGAFAWGVLDRLLEDDRIVIEAISATSAGAVNAAVAAHGLARGGRAAARADLEAFWCHVGDYGSLSPLQPTPWDMAYQTLGLGPSPAYLMLDLMSRVWSPYQLNPLNVNPLRTALVDTVDFGRLRSSSPVALFISATNVRSGKVRVFKTGEVTADVVMASACLPFLFQAVEIDGEAYWDGGFMGNPAIFPLIYDARSADVVIVHINPLMRPELPVTASQIMNRMNEISFNSSLMREMRAIAFVTRLIDEGRLEAARVKRMLMHSIAADEFMRSLSIDTKVAADRALLWRLRDVGRSAADRWLADNRRHLNVRGTIDFGVYL